MKLSDSADGKSRFGRYKRPVLTAVAVVGVFWGAAFAQEDVNNFIEELKLFSKALSVVTYAYVENVEPRKLLYNAMKGMLGSLDRYSEFIEPERYEKLKMALKGEYGGCGIVLDIKDNIPLVKSLIAGGPAEKAGILAQDSILKVDGVETKGKGLEEISKMIRGEPETKAVLTIFREALGKTWDVTILREKIIIEAVKDMRIVGKAIGYLRIAEWQEHTVEQFDKDVQELRDKGMKALLLDLRNNDGGLMPMAVGLAERFLPEGKKIVSVDSKVPEQKKDYTSSGKYTLPEFPVIILVNQFSASASEIFSAAMQDHQRATILGVKTFGKASVQSVVPFDDVSVMKLTTARYVSPLGRVIDKVGIKPDVEVQNGLPGTPNADQQTIKALEIFKEYF
jgi:carboxyl-terminal processing protease